MKIKMDKNGNKTLYIVRDNKTSRIQTNGNLPMTHRDGIGSWTEYEIDLYYKRLSF